MWMGSYEHGFMDGPWSQGHGNQARPGKARHGMAAAGHTSKGPWVGLGMWRLSEI